jgi:hypothetical protein
MLDGESSAALADRRLRPRSLTVGAVIFFAIGASELIGGALLLITPVSMNRGFGIITLLLGLADVAGGYGLWRRQMFLGVVLAVAGLFAEGAEMLFLPLLIGVGFVAFAYAFSVIIGYIIILILIASNWRTLLKDI